VLDEPIHLSPSDESWPSLAAVECSRLAGALSLPPSQIEHIGSTAVPGLLSKPILDIQVGALPFPPQAGTLSAMAQFGYTAHGEAGVRGRLYFTSRGALHFNVHVVQFDGEHWRNNLLLRQYLRESAVARERYASAKLAATSAGATTLLAYSAAKAILVTQLLAEAQATRSAG
jgi:GrpB-like predicted nucleotidyltransferase (UPF0157 family)